MISSNPSPDEPRHRDVAYDPSAAILRIRRSMLRTVSAVGLILVLVLGLAVGVVLMGMHAGRSEARAKLAERESQEQLWRSRLAQAGMMRMRGFAGQRFEGLELVKKAAEGFATLHGGESNDATQEARLQLRNEAAALLALPDVRVMGSPVPIPHDYSNIAIEPSLDRFAIANSARGISIRRLSDGGEIMSLDVPKELLPSTPLLAGLAWRPGGKHLAVWWRNGSVAMWEMPKGQLCYRWTSKTNADRMTAGFSPDGRYFGHYEADAKEMTWVDLSVGKTIANPLKTGRAAFAFRPGTAEVAVALSDEIQIWNVVTGEKLRSWPAAGWPAAGYLGRLAWSDDGRHLAAMNPAGEISLWCMDTSDVFVLHGHSGAAYSLKFSPDGRTLMSSSVDGDTRWWSTDTGHLALVTGEGRGIAYCKGGREILFEQNGHGLGRWKMASPQILQILSGPGGRAAELASFDLSPDGRWLSAIVSSGLQIWDLSKPGRHRHWQMDQLSSATFRPDGGLLLCNGGRLENRFILPALPTEDGWNGAFVLSPPLGIALPAGCVAKAAAFGADAHAMMVELTDRRILVLDAAGKRSPVFLPETERMNYYHWPATTTGSGRFALVGEGHRAAFGYGFGDGLTVFDTITGAKLLQVPRAGMISFSPIRKQLILGRDNGYDLLRTGDLGEIDRLEFPGLIRSNAVAVWSERQDLLALAVTPRKIQIHGANDHLPLLALTPPVPQNVISCRMSPDGNRLALGMTGNLIHLWDLKVLRRELSALGLDWPPTVATTVKAPASLLLSPLIVPALVAIGIAAAAAWFVLRRYQHLVEAYGNSEALVRDRNRELEQAHFSLVHGQKMTALGTLAAGVAHDFNNLLSVIRMSGKLIARQAPGNEEIREHAESIESAVLQGKQVVGSMLGYSRSRGDDGVHHVAEVVSDTVALLSTEFLSGISLTLELDRNTPPVAAAGGRIEQILLNLIVNASEAMNGSGRLTIGVRPAGELPAAFFLKPLKADLRVELTIQDTGPGIPPEILPRIFEPFFTTKNEGNRRGTGLGLSMIYSIAEQEGMGLAVDSTPGYGTTFRIFLPVAGADVRESHRPPSLKPDKIGQ